MSVKVEELAARLQGTCENAADEIEGLTDDELIELDNLVFCCTGCSWWCEIGEAVESSDGDICQDCADA